MSAETGISWTDSTFNPWIGCTKISPGCDHCYAAATMADRYKVVTWGAGQPRKRISDATWRNPTRWNERRFLACEDCAWRGEESRVTCASGQCPACGNGRLKPARRRVFCASLADVFDNEVSQTWRADLFALIERTPELDWLLLTKRIGNVDRMAPASWLGGPVQHGPDPANRHGGWPRNVWLGISVVNQAEADRDIPKLLETPAPVRFLSCEPLLGPINLRLVNRSFGFPQHITRHGHAVGMPQGIHWIIAGGESGPGARPVHPEWLRSLRDQCAAARVPFHFKQWGEWPPGECASSTLTRRSVRTAEWFANDWHFETIEGDAEFDARDEPDLYWVGKRKAGRLLDGHEHNGFPEAA